MKFKKFLLNNKYLSFCIFLIVIICSFIILQDTSIISVFNGNNSNRKLPIYCVETDKNQVSISFDAACATTL